MSSCQQSCQPSCQQPSCQQFCQQPLIIQCGGGGASGTTAEQNPCPGGLGHMDGPMDAEATHWKCDNGQVFPLAPSGSSN